MPRPTSSSGEGASIDILTKQLRKLVSRPAFDIDRWRSAKIQIAATPATDLAGVIEKLRIVDAETEIDADDSKILKSAIMDLERLLEIK